MSRVQKILKGISKSHKGLEIAPYHSPLTPKSEGYQCSILDVFDTDTLRRRGANDPNVPKDRLKQVENVDFVGSATELAALIPASEHGTFDYIISSHNFEHLPDPIKFLQGSATVLKPGGNLRLIVPDARACFDYFRPVTLLADWLGAHREQRARPTAEQVFSLSAYTAVLKKRDREMIAFGVGDPINSIIVKGDLSKAYDVWVKAAAITDYTDTHCTIMTPSSLQLLLEESRQLGLIDIEIESISDAVGCEFFVMLRKPLTHAATLIDPVAFQARRTELLRKMVRERSLNCFDFPFRRKLSRFWQKLTDQR